MLSEKAELAIDESGRLIAAGDSVNKNYNRIINPIKGGIITDFNALEQLLRILVNKSFSTNGKGIFMSALKSFIIIPDFSTEIEIRAVRDLFEHVGSREIFMIHSSYAIIEGIGEVNKNDSLLLIDSGEGKISFSIISNGEIHLISHLEYGSNKMKEVLRTIINVKYGIKCNQLVIEEILHNYISFQGNPKLEKLRVNGLDKAGIDKLEELDLKYLNESLLPYFDIIKNEVLIITDKLTSKNLKGIDYCIVTGGFSRLLGFQETISKIIGVSIINKSNEDYALKGLIRLDSDFEKNKKCLR